MSSTYSHDEQKEQEQEKDASAFADVSLGPEAGIEAEIVDLLQGRVLKTFFARHYFTPKLDYREKVITALQKLKYDIEC
jgi:hypothetical protein